MSKLSYEQRISIYNERKQGTSISTLSKKYNVRENVIQYMVCLTFGQTKIHVLCVWI